MAEENLVEGWTERIIQQLLNDGAAVNLTDCTVTLQVYDRAGARVALMGTTGVQDAATGKVYYDPAASDLLASKSSFKVRWKVVDGTFKVSFFPNNPPDTWIVRKP